MQSTRRMPSVASLRSIQEGCTFYFLASLLSAYCFNPGGRSAGNWGDASWLAPCSASDMLNSPKRFVYILRSVTFREAERNAMKSSEGSGPCGATAQSMNPRL